MNLTENFGMLDPFTHTEEDHEKIKNFGKSNQKVEKVKVVEGTHCTLVMVGGKYLQKMEFRKVLKKVDEIRKLDRI